MKTRELIRQIREAARARGVSFRHLREGSRHDLYEVGGRHLPVPRHVEVGPKVAFEIRRDLEGVLGPRWWRRP